MYQKKYEKYKTKYLNTKPTFDRTYYYNEIYDFIKRTFGDNDAKDFVEAILKFIEENGSTSFVSKNIPIDTYLFFHLLIMNPPLLDTFLKNIINVENYIDSNGNNIINLFIDAIENNIKRNPLVFYSDKNLTLADFTLDDNKINAILEKIIIKNNIFELNNADVSPFIKILLEKTKRFNLILSYADIKINTLEKLDLNYLVYQIYKNNTLALSIEDIDKTNIPILYQIANLHCKYAVAKSIYESYAGIDYQQYIVALISQVNRLEQVYDPLWLYNVDQIRNSIVNMLQSAKNDIVFVPMIKPIDSIDRFSVVEIDGKRWIVKPGIDRYFGAKHLEKYGIPVVNKKLIKIGDDDTINVSININPTKFPNQPIIKIDVENFFTLAEVIESKLKPKLADCRQYWKYGFFDNEKDNCAEYYNKSTNKKETIIIDTDMEKNFYDSCGRLHKYHEVHNTQHCLTLSHEYTAAFIEMYRFKDYSFKIQINMSDIGF